jgi:hypothetical protein
MRAIRVRLVSRGHEQHAALVDRVDGATIPDIKTKTEALAAANKDLLAQAAPVAAVAEEPAADPKATLETRLKALINTKPCMLFMKGSPEHPQCGFSAQIVEILNSLNADFGHFDILTDDSVRQGKAGRRACVCASMNTACRRRPQDILQLADVSAGVSERRAAGRA